MVELLPLTAKGRSRSMLQVWLGSSQGGSLPIPLTNPSPQVRPPYKDAACKMKGFFASTCVLPEVCECTICQGQEAMGCGSAMRPCILNLHVHCCTAVSFRHFDIGVHIKDRDLGMLLILTTNQQIETMQQLACQSCVLQNKPSK